jgi:hypothetical protein
VIGMVAGARLAEHENPGEATVLVLRGRVRLSADLSWEAVRGDLLIVPDDRHSLEALGEFRCPADCGPNCPDLRLGSGGNAAGSACRPLVRFDWQMLEDEGDLIADGCDAELVRLCFG